MSKSNLRRDGAIVRQCVKLSGGAIDMTLEEIQIQLPELFEKAVEIVEARLAKKTEIKQNSATKRLDNRRLYGPSWVLSLSEVAERPGEQKLRYHSDRVSAGGLLGAIFGSEVLVGCGFETDIIGEGETKAEREHDRRKKVMMGVERLMESGIRVSKETQAINWSMVRDYILEMFPVATDFTAYVHGLFAPLIPGGYIKADVSVTSIGYTRPAKFRTISKRNSVFDIPEGAGGYGDLSGRGVWRAAGVDGSGVYDPEHPDMQDLVRRYGHAVFQIRIAGPDGLFAKGVVRPVQGACQLFGTNTGITLDHLQVKGYLKDNHKKIAKNDPRSGYYYSDCHIGILRDWEDAGEMGLNFEILENIRDGEKELAALLTLQREAFARLTQGGIDAMLRQACKDDPTLSSILDMFDAAKARGINISGLALDTIRARTEEYLSRQLWRLATGAGVEGDQKVVILDSRVPEGMCVIAGAEVGRKHAVWRFPTVLACGLLVLKTMEPFTDMLINGEVAGNTIYISPLDAAKCQADDDGDIVAVSWHPRVVQLFEARQDSNYYSIEPAGTALTIWRDGVEQVMPTDSDEGFHYGAFDPRGPVGVYTIARTQLLAVGDYMGALAMSVCIQESIDQAKRKVWYTDWVKAADIRNWTEYSPGKFRLHRDGNDSRYRLWKNTDPEKMMKDIGKWVRRRLNAAGCIQSDEQSMNPISWKLQEDKDGFPLRKAISGATWQSCEEKSEGWANSSHLHALHDAALALWRDFEHQALGPVAEVTIRDMFSKLFPEYKLFKFGTDNDTIKRVDDLLFRTGFSEYGSAVEAAYKLDQEERSLQMLEALTYLQQCLAESTEQDLVALFSWFSAPRWRYWDENIKKWIHTSAKPDLAWSPENGPFQVHNMQSAMRALCFPGSPFMAKLGIESNVGCDYLLTKTMTPTGPSETMGRRIIKDCLANAEPVQRLARILFEAPGHAKAVFDEDGCGIDLHECNECRKLLEDSLTAALRRKKEKARVRELLEVVKSFRESQTRESVGF